MKANRVLLLFLGTAIIVTLFVCWYFRPPTKKNTNEETGWVEQAKSEIVTVSNIGVSAISSNSQLAASSPIQNPPIVQQTPNQPLPLTAAVKSQSWVDSQNKEINFCGKVVDQDGSPVAGVKIKVNVRQWQMSALNPQDVSGKMVPVEKETGADGQFSINGVKGDGFDFEYIQKTGYTLSAKTPHGFGPVGGSIESPVIIKMWKRGDPQQLIFYHLSRIGIPVDGQPVQFDLLNGQKVSSGGQMIVRLKRDPQILPPGNPRYDWSLELEIPNGGLIANNDDFLYRASESGYQPTYKFDMPKDADNWTKSLDQQFYIQLENGKYFGSLVIHLSTIHDTPPLGLNLDIVINPNGSRNLQP